MILSNSAVCGVARQAWLGVLEAGDARFKKAPGVGLSDHLGVVAS